MTIPVYQPQNNLALDSKLRDLPPILIHPSRFWMRCQFFLCLCFINLGFFALVPYLLSYLAFASTIVLMISWLLIHWVFFIGFKQKTKRNKYSIQISFKNGIGLVEIQNRKFYCELRSEILCWQRLVMIPFYCAETRKIIRIIIVKDSLRPQDNALLRRWIQSEFI